MGGLIARIALRNVSVADLVRRSLTLTPRLLALSLPVVVPAMLVTGWLGFNVLALALPAGGPGDLDARERVEIATLVVTSVMLSAATFGAPALSAIFAVPVIRGAFGERLRFGLLFQGARRAGGRGIVTGVLLALLTSVGYALCWLPGIILTALFMPAAVVAAIEGKGVAASFGRALEITRGQRLRLAGAVFLVWFFSALMARLFSILSPPGMPQAGLLDATITGFSLMFVACFGTVWQAALFAIAYNDARVAAERLEVDAIAVELGGGAQVGIDTGAEALSERALVMRQRGRKWIAIAVVLGIAGLVSYLVFYPIIEGKLADRARDERYRKEQEQSRRAAEQWAAEHRDDPPPRPRPGIDDAPEPSPRPASRPPPPPPVVDPAREVSAVIADLKSDDPNVRRAALGKDVPKLADKLWGNKVSALFRGLAKFDPSRYELALLPELSRHLGLYGCDGAMEEARGGEPAAASKKLAEACPAPEEKRVLDPKKAKAMPLWAAALSLVVELAARDYDANKDPLHEAVRAALAKERAQ